jgi:lipopolysaccharide transport system ATP-binding protein
MTAIKFENISKQYRLGLVSTQTLSHDLNRWFQVNIRRREDPYFKIGEVNDRSTKGDSDYVWALRDINFEVNQGDVVGIVGKNGAGKSTLLKILSKVTAPTTGTIKAHGRIASLLEVGTGFHPEMTGRENIYMNGAIMGMRKAEISRKLAEIVDFSGVERYIDTPTKRYSSGMTVRLGFAIAAHLDPEILVVDEVLAVGDAEFQKKAIGKMQDVSKGEGRTVLFVSHNMASLRSLCTQGVLMDKGMVVSSGLIGPICDMYLKGATDKDICGFWKRNDISKDKDFQISEVKVLNENEELNSVFSCDETIMIRMTFLVLKKIPGIYGCLYLKRDDGTIVYVSDSNDKAYNKLESLPLGESVVDFQIPKRILGVGSYTVSLYFTSNFNIGGFYVDTPGDVCKFELYDDTTNRGNNRAGFLSTIVDWKIKATVIK